MALTSLLVYGDRAALILIISSGEDVINVLGPIRANVPKQQT